MLMGANASQLGMFGHTETLLSMNTYQFNDYSRYDVAQFSVDAKEQTRAIQFPIDLHNAYELGKRLVNQAEKRLK